MIWVEQYSVDVPSSMLDECYVEKGLGSEIVGKANGLLD